MGKFKRKSDSIKEAAFDKQPTPIVEVIPTGATIFDLALGGGIPRSRIVNLVGDRSTGKTLLASEIVAAGKAKYGKKFKWFYDDAERGYSFNSDEIYGFDIVADEEDCSYTIEEFGNNVTKQLKKLDEDDVFIYILDSLDSLTSEAELARAKAQEKARAEGKEIKTGTYNLEKQKYLGQFFRMKAKEIQAKNCVLIIISQVRENIGLMFGPKFYRTGGKALDHNASQIIWLAEVEKHKTKDLVTGVTIKAQVTKNKIGKPFRECFVDLLFDYGVDDITSNAVYLFELQTDKGKRKKKTITWKGKEYKTLKSFIRYVETKGLEEELQQAVQEKWLAKEKAVAPNRKGKY